MWSGICEIISVVMGIIDCIRLSSAECRLRRIQGSQLSRKDRRAGDLCSSCISCIKLHKLAVAQFPSLCKLPATACVGQMPDWTSASTQRSLTSARRDLLVARSPGKSECLLIGVLQWTRTTASPHTRTSASDLGMRC